MKKILYGIMILSLVCGIVGCGKNKSVAEEEKDTVKTIEDTDKIEEPEEKEYNKVLLDEESGLHLVDEYENKKVVIELGDIEEEYTPDPYVDDTISLRMDYADGIPYGNLGVICDAEYFRVEVNRKIVESTGYEEGGGTNYYSYVFYPKKSGDTSIYWVDRYYTDDSLVGNIMDLTIDEDLMVKENWYAMINSLENFTLKDESGEEIK